jgi:hypothetical protein
MADASREQTIVSRTVAADAARAGLIATERGAAEISAAAPSHDCLVVVQNED